jgi:uncharacterized protein YuzE
MKLKFTYFNDTDTVYLKLSDKTPVETKALDNNFYIDVDEKGDIVSMTIEHAKEKANINDFSFKQIVDSTTAA